MAAPTLLRTAVTCRCPRCGRGSLFRGVLTMRRACNACGLSLTSTGDGVTYGLILALAAVALGVVLWIEIVFEPPIWLYLVLWPTIALPVAIILLRSLKAALIAHHVSRAGVIDKCR